MEDKLLLFKESSHNGEKPITYATRSYPKNDESGRWIVEYYDVYKDGTEILTRAEECDKDRVSLVTFLLSQ